MTQLLIFYKLNDRVCIFWGELFTLILYFKLNSKSRQISNPLMVTCRTLFSDRQEVMQGEREN